MLLPLVAWALTGAAFFLKPGYGGAYASLPIRTYALTSGITLDARPGWHEVRRLRTVLGDHLLARTDIGWLHLDPRSLEAKALPAEGEIRTLLTDAFAIDPERYGHIVAVDRNVVTTDTGVRVTLDWNVLTLAQRGRDTDWIDRIYKIHYLQWTGIPVVDRILGGAGIVLVLLLSVLGLKLFVVRRPRGEGSL